MIALFVMTASTIVAGSPPSVAYAESYGLSLEVVEITQTAKARCRATVRFKRIIEDAPWQIGACEEINVEYYFPNGKSHWKAIVVQLGDDFSLGKSKVKLVEYDFDILPGSKGVRFHLGASNLKTRGMSWREVLPTPWFNWFRFR